ncbi:hypothetical protein BCV71DRAFT_266425 [Rhizopus microsporus]|uniref:RNI-like protein n=1 Tax=Rhizopus microsporus TaxID=58291 RepID=A0A1X0RU59_RHIZD|nr:hypothetical protein BCV71DRAFT_266425 [Rhizopus microsporus]
MPQIDKFIDFHENPASDRLVPLGKYVKRVTTGEGREMPDKSIPLENFATFVKHCPEVTSVNISLTAYLMRTLKIKSLNWIISTNFPLLEELALPSTVVITDIQDFMFICNACSNLTELDLHTNMNDNARLVAGFAVCPSLKTLSVKCRSLIPKALVDYIAASLVNLSNVTLWMEITAIQVNFGEIYKHRNKIQM